MRSVTFTLLLALLVLLSCTGSPLSGISAAQAQQQQQQQQQGEEAVEQESLQVAQVNRDELYATLDAHDRVLVLWTAQGSRCAQCRTAEKISEALLNKPEVRDRSIHLVEVDCDRHAKLCNTFKVTTYPHYTFFLDGYGVYEYPSPSHQLTSLVTWMESLLKSKVTLFEDISAVEDVIANSIEYLVGFFNGKDSKAYRSFVSTAYKLYGEFSFGAYFAEDEDAFQATDLYSAFQEDMGELPSILLFHQGAGGVKAQRFSGNFTRRALTDFAVQTSSLHLNEIPRGHMNTFLCRQAKTLVAYVDYEDENHSWLLLALEELAENSPGATFGYICKSDYVADLEYFGVSEASGPVFVLFELGQNQQYLFTDVDGLTPDEFDVNDLEQWLKLALAHRVHRYVKKEQQPVEQDGPVTVLVHDTYYDATHQEGDDSLVILYYLSSCSHSMQFVPVYAEVAAKYADKENISFAQIDMEKNPQPPGARVFNFPTVRVLFGEMQGRHVNFVGHRTVDALSAFLEENIPSLSEDVVDTTASEEEEEEQQQFGVAE